MRRRLEVCQALGLALTQRLSTGLALYIPGSSQYADVPLYEALNTCFCLLLGHYLWSDNPNAPIVEGLVLQRSQDVESFYSRVGIFQTRSKETCQALGIIFPPGELLGCPMHGLFQQVLAFGLTMFEECVMRYTLMRYTPMRCTPVRYTPMRCR